VVLPRVLRVTSEWPPVTAGMEIVVGQAIKINVSVRPEGVPGRVLTFGLEQHRSAWEVVHLHIMRRRRVPWGVGLESRLCASASSECVP
jgi:hypothetical protein